MRIIRILKIIPKANACCAICGIDMGFETDEDVYCDKCCPWR